MSGPSEEPVENNRTTEPGKPPGDVPVRSDSLIPPAEMSAPADFNELHTTRQSPTERFEDLLGQMDSALEQVSLEPSSVSVLTEQISEVKRLAEELGRFNEVTLLMTKVRTLGLFPTTELVVEEDEQRNVGEYDHRELARQMELFVQMPFAPGAPVLLPNGMTMFRALQETMREFLRDVGGYQEVRAPLLCKQDLWRTSGHIEKYGKNMFLFNDGHFDVGLKPMNCPVHMMIFGMRDRSYRELPVRYHDEGTLHRNENVGTLTGMTRLRQFHQDDTHIFVAPEMLTDELHRLLGMVDRAYGKLGIEYKLKLSTRPENYIGTLDVWEHSEGILERVMQEREVNFDIDAGGGAFYGPKIDVDIRDASGKWWQVATTQLDFNLPERFKLNYVTSAGTYARPIVIHTAIFGTLERFMAIMLEGTQGNLPTWLAPEQVRVLPVSAKFADYAKTVADTLKDQRVRVTLDDSNDRLNARLMAARPLRAPYLLVVGGREASDGTVSVRQRGSSESHPMGLDQFTKVIREEAAFKL